MISEVARYAVAALVATALQLSVLLLPLLALAALMHVVAGFATRGAERTMGRAWYLALFGWLGTIVHEAGHAAFCIVFRHRIVRVTWFDGSARDGTLGQVVHTYETRSFYQRAGNFFIGIGPILLGALALWLSARALLGAGAFAAARPVIAPRRAGLDMLTASTVGMQLWRSISASAAALFTATHLATWRFWLFVYLAFAIGSSVELSREDLAGAREGLIVLVLAVLVFNLATLWIGSVARHAVALAGWIYGPLFVVIAIAVLINGMVAGALSIVPARRD